jgi:hypothetical protein
VASSKTRGQRNASRICWPPNSRDLSSICIGIQACANSRFVLFRSVQDLEAWVRALSFHEPDCRHLRALLASRSVGRLLRQHRFSNPRGQGLLLQVTAALNMTFVKISPPFREIHLIQRHAHPRQFRQLHPQFPVPLVLLGVQCMRPVHIAAAQV